MRCSGTRASLAFRTLSCSSSSRSSTLQNGAPQPTQPTRPPCRPASRVLRGTGAFSGAEVTLLTAGDIVRRLPATAAVAGDGKLRTLRQGIFASPDRAAGRALASEDARRLPNGHVRARGRGIPVVTLSLVVLCAQSPRVYLCMGACVGKVSPGRMIGH